MPHTGVTPLLVQQLQAGDHHAYTAIFEQHWKMVFDIAYRKTGRKQEALDIVQEIFAMLWEKRDQLKIHGDIGPWLAGTAKNKVIDWYRVQQKQEAQQQQWAQTPLIAMDIPASVSYEKVNAQWQLVISQLPERTRQVYLLQQVEGLNIAQIAARLSLQPQSVKNYLGRATEQVRAHMKNYIEATISMQLLLSFFW